LMSRLQSSTKLPRPHHGGIPILAATLNRAARNTRATLGERMLGNANPSASSLRENRRMRRPCEEASFAQYVRAWLISWLAPWEDCGLRHTLPRRSGGGRALDPRQPTQRLSCAKHFAKLDGIDPDTITQTNSSSRSAQLGNRNRAQCLPKTKSPSLWCPCW
jgi:hypothetical protein